jgi:hypothetical protein
MPTLNASGGPQTIYMNASVSKREPLASSVKVSFVSPDQSANYPLSYDSSDGHWQIDVSPGPDDPFQVIVEPFEVTGACGDVYKLTEPVTWTRTSIDSYSSSCPRPLVSPSCGAGMYDNGDGGCATCDAAPTTVTYGCSDFAAATLVSDGRPLEVDFAPQTYPREPLTSSVDVAYVSPDLSRRYLLAYDSGNGSFTIDLSNAPDDPADVIVQPFTAPGACGGTFELTEPLDFVRLGPDDYVLSCP